MPADLKPGRSKICRLWHIGQSPLAYRTVTAAICQRSPQPWCWIWRTSFNNDGCVTLWTFALKWPIFKQKKRSATISSMGSSQLPSRDTVPLNYFFKIRDRERETFEIVLYLVSLKS
jgi:hypothetical protein